MAGLSVFRPLIALVDEHAAAWGRSVAMRQKRHGIWQETTWSDLAAEAQALAAGLIGLGMRPGAHVGILSDNRREWLVSELGIWAAQGVCVGLYPTSAPTELRQLLAASDVTILFVEDQEQLDKILEMDAQLPDLVHLVIFDPQGTVGQTPRKLIALDELLERGRAVLARQAAEIARRKAATLPQDRAMLVFTSGSSGLPKAAEISHGNLWAAVEMSRQMLEGYPPGTHLFSYLPLCHIAEQYTSVISTIGGRRIIHFGESARTFTQDLRDVAPEIFLGVPRVWEKMKAQLELRAEEQGKGPVSLRGALLSTALRGARARGGLPRAEWTLRQRLVHAVWDLLIYRHLRAHLGLARCRFPISAAAPITPDVLAFLRGLGLDLREAWGMTETTGAATIQPPGAACEGRVGLPLQGVELAIAPDGEVLVRGPTVFKGYYRAAQATAETLVDGWLHTGDLGRRMPDGSITIEDRKKDIMITAGGKNLSPTLIEGVLTASPFIRQAVAIAEGRPFVTALIQIDPETVGFWAQSRGITHTTFRSLAEHPDVRRLIEAEVEQQNRNLARVAQVKKLHLLAQELDPDDGDLTATMKLRRAAIARRHAAAIEAMYA